jgi:hypothetical protein
MERDVRPRGHRELLAGDIQSVVRNEGKVLK